MMTCIHVPLIVTDDRPVLTQLLQLQTRDKKPIRLLQDIVPYYGTFGTCLLDDENGVKMRIIESNHKSVEDKTTAIFTKFIEGKIVFLSQTCIHVHVVTPVACS